MNCATATARKAGARGKATPKDSPHTFIKYRKGDYVVKFIFVYTDSNAPSVSSGAITNLAYSVVNGKKTWTITIAADGSTRTYNEDQGRPAILWD